MPISASASQQYAAKKQLLTTCRQQWFNLLSHSNVHFAIWDKNTSSAVSYLRQQCLNKPHINILPKNDCIAHHVQNCQNVTHLVFSQKLKAMDCAANVKQNIDIYLLQFYYLSLTTLLEGGWPWEPPMVFNRSLALALLPVHKAKQKP